MDYLSEGLLKLGFGEDSFFGIQTEKFDALYKKLSDYANLLLEWNQKFNLVNADSFDEIAVRHILDSLSAAKILAEEFSNRNFSGIVADIGSGAGLPGIPLACAFSSTPFVLVERMTKRCGFLKTCVETLNLQNVFVEESQLEQIEKARFGACVFRAFRPLDKKMLKMLLHTVKIGGFLAAYKAKREKIDEELSALSNLPPHKIEPLTVPFLTENAIDGENRQRNLVIIKKTQ